MRAVKKLITAQDDNKSMICLGLDLDPKRMPAEYTKSIKGMFDFTHAIIRATSDLVCAYKPNMAFYESLGSDGLSLLKLILERIPKNVPVILDAKRGDIGNTSSHYAQSIFELMDADWVTLNPYMGYDSLRPFLEYKDKGIFVLCLTSNTGSKDFQRLMVDGKPLYRVVAEKVAYWDKEGNCGLVVGATAPEQLEEIRSVAGEMPLLIPGVGAQGGSLEQAAKFGTANFRLPAVINVSRSVLYASKDADFAQRSRQELMRLNAIITTIKEGVENNASEADGTTSSAPVNVTTEKQPETVPVAPSAPEQSSNEPREDHSSQPAQNTEVKEPTEPPVKVYPMPTPPSQKVHPMPTPPSHNQKKQQSHPEYQHSRNQQSAQPVEAKESTTPQPAQAVEVKEPTVPPTQKVHPMPTPPPIPPRPPKPETNSDDRQRQENNQDQSSSNRSSE